MEYTVLEKSKVNHTLQVTSFGGCGTTMLIDWLRSQGLQLPLEEDCGEWKHAASPPLPNKYNLPLGFRAIYLVGSPRLALLSIFRRNIHYYHAWRMGATANPTPDLFRDNPEWGLAEYIQNGQDYFQIEQQFDNWTTSPYFVRQYPIMIINNWDMWHDESLERLLAFVGLPTNFKSAFPAQKDRLTICDNKHEESIKLVEMYTRLSEKISRFSGCTVI
jgi:hypothetical protein